MEYIVNPLTNRKVSIYGKKGREILNNYIKVYLQNGGSTQDINTCVKSKINCSKKKYPCYIADTEKCCNKNKKQCVNSNFHSDNLLNNCILDNVNCSDKKYPCYRSDEELCYSIDQTKHKYSNFSLDNIYGPCIIDKINCKKNKYPCYDFDNNKCCNKKRSKCVKGTFNL